MLVKLNTIELHKMVMFIADMEFIRGSELTNSLNERITHLLNLYNRYGILTNKDISILNKLDKTVLLKTLLKLSDDYLSYVVRCAKIGYVETCQITLEVNNVEKNT